MITQSGAEGISLKHVRSVHLIEPYWNYIRTDQVIGRAVRTGSHLDMNADEKNVSVYIYFSTFTEKQITNSFTIKTLDKSKTSDQYIYDVAKRKKQINENILKLLQQSSVDCALNGKSHNLLKCFSFPINMDENKISFENDISKELYDEQFNQAIETSDFSGIVYITKKGNFILNTKTNEVYDYDIYMDSKRLVKLGILKIKDNKKSIYNN
jgi:hypothetical protein